MNYITLLNKFYDLMQETRVSRNAQLLYHTLLMINNKCSWADWFKRTNVTLSGMMIISEKALTDARNELKQLGLIDFITSKKRGECTQYHLLNTAKSGTKVEQKEYKSGTNETQSADINKQKLKPKLSQKENCQNKFNQFPQRNYSESDYLEMESKLLNNTEKNDTESSRKDDIDVSTKIDADVSTNDKIIRKNFTTVEEVFGKYEPNQCNDNF